MPNYKNVVYMLKTKRWQLIKSVQWAILVFPIKLFYMQKKRLKEIQDGGKVDGGHKQPWELAHGGTWPNWKVCNSEAFLNLWSYKLCIFPFISLLPTRNQMSLPLIRPIISLILTVLALCITCLLPTHHLYSADRAHHISRLDSQIQACNYNCVSLVSISYVRYY